MGDFIQDGLVVGRCIAHCDPVTDIYYVMNGNVTEVVLGLMFVVYYILSFLACMDPNGDLFACT